MRTFLFLLLFLTGSHAAFGQQLFGSVDDPAEYNGLAWWESEALLDLSGGLSLIGPQWRSFGRVTFQARRSELGLKMDAGARAGVYGTYSDDFDDWRDALRVLEYARYTPRNSQTYIRLGPLDRARLGTGHLVNFFSSDTAWDERSLGLEATFGSSVASLEFIAEDVTEQRLMGARLSARPLASARGILGSLWLSATGLTDASTQLVNGDNIRAFGFDARLTAYTTGAFLFQPFASYAELVGMGRGVLVGADLVNDNFIDLARLHIRLALHYNSAGFLPGYVGSLYTVSGYRADILSSDRDTGTILAGLPLDKVWRENSVWTEIRLHFFERFELWYQFLRHHGVQSLSEYHLRLFMKTNSLVLAVGQDRAGLDGFLSLFGSDDNQNVLRFQVDYRVTGPVWVRADARYTYSRAFTTKEGRARFVAQRRFEPVLGVRFKF